MNIITENMNKTMTIDLAKVYIKNFKSYEGLFSKNTIETCLGNYKLRDFATFQYIQANRGNEVTGTMFDKLGYIRVTPKCVYSTFKEYRGSWSREVEHLSLEYIVPDNYQLEEIKFLKECLLMEFPYLTKYNFSCYHLDECNEIYINALWDEKLRVMHIYCPISALKEKNPAIIEKRMTSYWNSYYGSPDKKEYLDKVLSIFESKVYSNLVKDITQSKNN